MLLLVSNSRSEAHVVEAYCSSINPTGCFPKINESKFEHVDRVTTILYSFTIFNLLLLLQSQRLLPMLV